MLSSLYFFSYNVDMANKKEDEFLTGIEEGLKEEYESNRVKHSRVPSTAGDLQGSTRINQLVLPGEKRPKMPLTKEKYIIRENPQLIEWERIVRQFLRNLSPAHGHRVSGVMVYEWATGIRIVDLIESGGNANSDLRKINQCLRFYFGKSYQTYIAGRKVPNAYRIKPGYYITRHRPLTLALWYEYQEGTLSP